MLGVVNNQNNAGEDSATIIRDEYLRSLALLDQAHRRLLEVVKDDLDRDGDNDLNGVQALLLFHIGEGDANPSALKAKGVYSGSNVSYNVKKLVDGGYIRQERSDADKRATRLSLTPAGRAIRSKVRSLFEKHLSALEPAASLKREDLAHLNRVASRLERFWSDQIRYRL